MIVTMDDQEYFEDRYRRLAHAVQSGVKYDQEPEAPAHRGESGAVRARPDTDRLGLVWRLAGCSFTGGPFVEFLCAAKMSECRRCAVSLARRGYGGWRASLFRGVWFGFLDRSRDSSIFLLVEPQGVHSRRWGLPDERAAVVYCLRAREARMYLDSMDNQEYARSLRVVEVPFYAGRIPDDAAARMYRQEEE